MKKLLLPMAMALTTMTYAGGNIAPVETVEEIPVVVDTSAWYLGLGVSMMRLNADLTDESMQTTGLSLQAGYSLNPYIGIEARYSMNVSDIDYDAGTTVGANNSNYPADYSNIGVYLKPSYPVGDLNLYGLLGYGSVTFTNLPVGTGDRTEDGFQWGLGTSYAMTDAIRLFIDYTSFYNDNGIDGHFTTSDILMDSVTVGVSYRF